MIHAIRESVFSNCVVTTIWGPVASGKTAELIMQIRNCGDATKIVVQHVKDNSEELATSVKVQTLMELIPEIQDREITHVFVNGGHFFSDIMNFLANVPKGTHITIAGSEYDCNMRPLEPMYNAFHCSRRVISLRGVCDICGQKCEYTDQKYGVVLFPCCHVCHSKKLF